MSKTGITKGPYIKIPYSELSDKLVALGDNLGLKVHVMHEDIFNTMYHV